MYVQKFAYVRYFLAKSLGTSYIDKLVDVAQHGKRSSMREIRGS